MALYREYLKYDYENDDAYCYIGECYLNMARYKMALRNFTKACHLNPLNDIAWFSAGLIQWMNGNLDESIRLIRSAINAEGGNSEYWFTLGRVLTEAGYENEVRQALNKATSLMPSNADIWIFYAKYLHNKGETDGAITVLKKANRLNKKNASIKYYLAAYLLEKNQETEAFGQLKKALILDFSLHDNLFSAFPKAAKIDSVKKLIKAYKPHK